MLLKLSLTLHMPPLIKWYFPPEHWNDPHRQTRPGLPVGFNQVFIYLFIANFNRGLINTKIKKKVNRFLLAFIITIIIIIIIIKYSKPTEIPWRCLTIIQTWDAHRVPYNIILHLSQAYKNIYWLLKCVFTVLNMWLMNIKASGDEPTRFPFGFLWGECCRCCSSRTGALPACGGDKNLLKCQRLDGNRPGSFWGISLAAPKQHCWLI